MFEVEGIAMKAGYRDAGVEGLGEAGGQQSTGGPHGGEPGKYTFRPIEGCTQLLKVLLGAGVVLGAVALISSLMQLHLLNQPSYSQGQALANDLRERLVGLAQIVLFAVTAVAFGCWIVRAQKNVRALGATGLRISPNWAVGYFFIPVLCLWRPYQAMKDLWLASHNPAEWRGTKAPALLANWWGLWILSHFVGRLAFELGRNGEGVSGLRTATYVWIGSGVVEVLLCLTALRLVSQIAGAQMSRARRANGPDDDADHRVGAVSGSSWRSSL